MEGELRELREGGALRAGGAVGSTVDKGATSFAFSTLLRRISTTYRGHLYFLGLPHRFVVTSRVDVTSTRRPRCHAELTRRTSAGANAPLTQQPEHSLRAC